MRASSTTVWTPPTARPPAIDVAVLSLLLLLACASPGPSRVLWAWSSEQDLRFLAGQPVGVAFLARTVTLTPSGTPVVTPRRTAVRLAPDTWRAAVVRIEGEGSAPTDTLVDAILPALGDADALQLDWDVTVSQRPAYAALTRALRPRVHVPLLVTALASWCVGDRWLAALDVDGAVPMYFRLGVPTVAPPVDPLCLGRVGLSTDEPAPPFSTAAGLQTWVFHPGPWTAEAFGSLP